MMSGPNTFVLYEEAVQSPEVHVELYERAFAELRGQRACSLREDFCGTCFISCEWVKKRRRNYAYGVDLHKPTLNWGLKHNASKLTWHQAARLHQINENVLNVTKPKVDVIGAELQVLRGAEGIVERAHPVILFASGAEKLAPFGTKPGDLYDWMVERGYAVYFLKDYLADGEPSDRKRFLAAHDYPFQAFNFVALHGGC